MDSERKQFELGPALAIVIVLGVVATAGIYFYKELVDKQNQEPGAEITISDRMREMWDKRNNTENQDLSESDDLEAIEADLEATVEADLSLLDELDEQLLDFEDLEDFDFEL